MESITLLVVVWGLSAFTLTTGVGAGAVYSPMFVFVFGLDIPSAVATSVVVQLAGVGTTALSHRRDLNTDPGLAFRLGGIAAVGVVMVSLIGSRVPAMVSEIVFVVGMLSIGVAILTGVHLSREPVVVDTHSRRRLSTRQSRDGTTYDFCRPSHGFELAWVAGVATGALGVSGAEVQISSLIVRCRVPTRIAVGTGTVAAALALLAASALAVFGHGVAWSLAVVAIPAAVLGSMTARFSARHISDNTLRVVIGLLVIVSAAGVAVRELMA